MSHTPSSGALVWVLASYRCCDYLLQAPWLQQHRFILQFWRSHIRWGRRRQSGDRAGFLLEAPGEGHFLAFASCRGLLYFPWLVAPFPSRSQKQGASPSHASISPIPFLPPSSVFKDPCDYVEPDRRIQDSPPILRSDR